MGKMSKKQLTRLDCLMPLVNGKREPKHFRIYDNGGETYDRYTAVFKGRYKGRNRRCMYIGFCDTPTHPRGYWQHEDSQRIIDVPSYGHLGKKIKFSDLPEKCQELLIEEYREVWELPNID